MTRNISTRILRSVAAGLVPAIAGMQFLLAGMAFAQTAGAGQSGIEGPDAPSIVEYCVRCTAPRNSYVCSVTVESSVVSVGEWQAFCSAQLAYDARHGACEATPGLGACEAQQRYSYYSGRNQEIVGQPSAPGQPGPRAGGVFEGAADYVLQTGEDVGETISQGASAVGQSIRSGAATASETAGNVGRGVMRGAREVGDGVARGVGCVFTLGRQC